MEIEFLAGLLACNFELAQQGLLVYADAHGGEFDGAAERGIPYQDVTVESLAAVAVGRRPVVVVGRAAVVRLSVGELAAYTYYKYGSILLAYQIFAFLDALAGIASQEVFALDEVYLVGQEGLYLRVTLAHQVFSAAYRGVDAAHGGLQEVEVALFGGHHGFPVPLVNVERVQVVKLLVGAYGVHVGIDAVARLHLIVGQGEPLPLGKRVHHFGAGVAKVFDGERHGAFHSVEVVVYAEAFQHEQRRGDAAQAQFGGKVHLEKFFYQFYPLLRLAHIKQGLVAHRLYQFAHVSVGLIEHVGKDTKYLSICK